MNIKAKKINRDQFDYEPGHYTLITMEGREGKLLLITLPCGHNFIPDGRWEEKDREDEDKITLIPSINCSNCWHGYLTNGEFITL